MNGYRQSHRGDWLTHPSPTPHLNGPPQIEFYFSDSNLPRDAFMLEQSKAHPEGFVPLRVISLFSRMKTLLKLDKACKQVPAALMDVIVGIVKRSSVLALNEDATAVKRVEVGVWGGRLGLDGRGCSGARLTTANSASGVALGGASSRAVCRMCMRAHALAPLRLAGPPPRRGAVEEDRRAVPVCVALSF